MKAKKDFLLKKMADEYILVPIGAENMHFNGLVRLNASGAWLWEQLAEDITADALIQRMCARYEGLDEATAARDLQEFLQSVKPALEAE